MPPSDAPKTPEEFVAYWHAPGGSERSNYQLFINELCDLIGARRPARRAAEDDPDEYVYERPVRALDADAGTATSNYIDCYRRGRFVLEAKQSNKRVAAQPAHQPDMFGAAPRQQGAASWDRLMRQARAQAERYAKALPQSHGWPPFLVVVDVGHAIELFADFSGLGKAYMPFPDARRNRISLADLLRPEVRELLRAVWEDPLSLDPAIRRTQATKDIALRLARLARLLEKRHDPKTVSEFLMRCLFTAFAEDVGLLKADGFLSILRQAEADPRYLPRYLDPLWRDMDTGSDFNPFLSASVRHFNGGLFKDARAIPLEADELRELMVAVRADWRQVEPAIFGTLLETALDPRERGSLGAHFTPRAYVERLIVPVLAEPLAADWAGVQAAAESLRAKGDARGAVREIRAFHDRLCALRVLDPACGTGNFLYVALEHLKRLEAEVLVALEELGEARQDALDLRGHAVGPHQFLGIEKNPRAVPIAELVIWIGYLQWHLRTRGAASLGDPILASHDTIAHADAILAWRERTLVRAPSGRPVTKWDGVTWRTDPVTGRPVPDETARVEVYRYADPRPADWPEADFIVGNPPFIGGKDLRQELGDGYAEALWTAYPHIPGGADLVMFWWDKAAARVRAGRTRRFGFITSNSITQTFSRRVVRAHLEAAKAPLHLVFAVPDHPWADGSGSAAVRIAMTVGAPGPGDGVLKTVTAEGEPSPSDGAVPVTLSRVEGRINADLTVGADVATTVRLRANERLSSRGMSLHGSGFIVTPAKAAELGLGAVDGLDRHIRPYRNGRDLTGRPRGAMVIDLFGLDEDDVRRRFPAVWQHVRDTVWPEREHNNRATYRDNWWIFGEPRRELRPALHGLPRYIATVETAKHRVFQFLPAEILPDNMLVAIGLSDGFSLGVLSSRQHVAWALAAGGWLGYGNDPRYSKSRCFDPFPFPKATALQRAEIGGLAEELDAQRKRVLAAHPSRLTLTGLYNALEARRSGRALDDAEREIDRLGEVAVLAHLHERIDAAVAAAYGWPAGLADAEVLARLVALNRERAREEARGLVRWLRPEFQDPAGTRAPRQIEAELPAAGGPAVRRGWPSHLSDQMAAVLDAVSRSDSPVGATDLARRFRGVRAPKLADCLSALAAVGRLERTVDGRYRA